MLVKFMAWEDQKDKTVLEDEIKALGIEENKKEDTD